MNPGVRWFFSFVVVGGWLWCSSVIPAHAVTPAFPGAEGAGANTVGGRGGTVYQVTNLNDSGAGSLRACATASGPRTCVFRTGGTIPLTSDLTIKNPYLTIAGQTAPGGGITLRDYSVRIYTYEVIIRYLRLRPGQSAGGNLDNKDGVDIGFGKSDISVQNRNIILDHLSISWATDENVSIWNSPFPETTTNQLKNITIQWSIIAEGLRAGHTEPNHSKGLLVGEGVDHLSIHHNLFAHNTDRNPFYKSGGLGEVVNNVLYGNTIDMVIGPTQQEHTLPSYLNIIGNQQILGTTGQYMIRVQPGVSLPSNCGSDTTSPYKLAHRLYLRNNLGNLRTVSSQPETDVVSGWYGTSVRCMNSNWFVSTPHSLSGEPITTHSLSESYNLVLTQAGASKIRDAVDTRIIGEVKNRTGIIPLSTSEVGGYPTLQGGAAPSDQDSDGMADSWELSQGLNPNSRDDAADANGNGYTNLEEYLNSLVSSTPLPTPRPSVTPTIPPIASPTPLQSPVACPNDYTGDRQRNIQDLLVILNGWGSPYGLPELLSFLASFGLAC